MEKLCRSLVLRTMCGSKRNSQSIEKLASLFFFTWLMLFYWMSNGIAQQVTDENFNYLVSLPMYKIGKGPLILFDEAHNNASTLKGSYSTFGKLLLSDGYNVISSKEKVSLELLKKNKDLRNRECNV